MPYINWNPRNYAYGPAASNMLQNGTGYIGSDGKVHSIKKSNKK